MSSPIAQRSLGGDASHVKVGAVGYGCVVATLHRLGSWYIRGTDGVCVLAIVL